MARLAAALLVLLSVLAAPAAAQTAWFPYVGEGGRFEAAFPAEPKIADIQDASGLRKFDLIVELADEEAYFVSIYHFPSGTEAGVPAAQVIDKIVNAARQKGDFAGATILENAPFAMGRWQGRELAMRNDKGLVYRGRIFWVGTTLYRAFTVVGDARLAQAPVKRFLDSFKILKE